MRLSAYATGRDNNFNLLRCVAAFAVLYSHSYALALGGRGHEPWQHRIACTPGDVAVDVFFVTSGFLVTASLLRLGDIAAYARARALRIFPALIVMSLLLTCVLGPLFTARALADYFGDGRTWEFLAKNATTLFGAKFNLPGVFEHNPLRRTVNGSLWTLPFELRCYIALALAWWAVKFAKGDASRNFARVVVIGAAAMLAGFWWSRGLGLSHWPVFRLSWFFFCGAAFWVLRDRVPLHGWIAAVLACAVAIGVVFPSLFFVVYPLALAYLVLWCAYVPGGWLRAYNRVGDYSYGVYIYAFAVQQAVVATWPGIGVAGTFFAAGAITLALAMASWHWIEKPMLARKARSAPG